MFYYKKKKIKQGTEVDTMGGNGNESENERRGKGLYFRWGCWGRCPCIDGIFKQKLYQCPIAAVRNNHNLSGLKQHKCVILQFRCQKSEMSLMELKSR